MRFFVLTFMVLCLTVACAQTGPVDPRRGLVMGDSMLAWNSLSQRSVPDVMESELGFRVVHNAVSGATIANANGIPGQFEDGDWDFIVMNGGANDLIFRCGCSTRCGPVLDGLATEDGTDGAIPRLLARLQQTGAPVIYAGYHRARDMNAPLRSCGAPLDELDRRIALFATQTPGVTFANLQDVFPAGDSSFYAWDRTHPSAKGSRRIADALIETLKRHVPSLEPM